MKSKFSLISYAALLLFATLNPQPAAWAQGTAFTYQGRLNGSNGPATGSYDFQFLLYNALTGGAQAGSTLTVPAIDVTNGLFTMQLDFGNVFTGSSLYLLVQVRTNAAPTYSPLSPRQPLTPTPYAITAENLVAGSGLSGTYGNAVTLNNANNSFSGSFAGNGANLTNVNATTLGGLNAGNFWQLGGNAGTLPGVNYVGTSDNNGLELHVNGGRALLLQPTVSAPNLIGGYSGNAVDSGAQGATIGGGGTIGYFNQISSTLGTVSGGSGNIIQTNANDSTIAGGRQNVIDYGAWGAVIGGGHGNSIQGSTNPGGVGGNASYSIIGGGYGNIIQSNANFAALIGGWQNEIDSGAWGASIGGGYKNWIQSTYNSGIMVTGQFDFPTNSSFSGIGGGFNNIISSNCNFSVIGGGFANSVRGNVQFGFATVGGGSSNAATEIAATVSGGVQNRAIGPNCFVGGGGANLAGGNNSTCSGGGYNQAIGQNCTVGGGYENTATGMYATIPGGFFNRAIGDYTLAVGNGAQALHQGTFVWADSAGSSFSSTSTNQFLIRAGGGVGINTPNPQSELSVVQANAGGRGAELSLVNNAISTVGNEVAINFGTDPSTYDGDNPNAQIKARSVNSNNATDLIFSTYNGNSFGERIRIQNSGNVGIGTATPGVCLDVQGPTTSISEGGATTAYLFNNGLTTGYTGNYLAVSIRASGEIIGTFIGAVSDERIKTIKGHSDGAADLRTLGNIEITDYVFKDAIGKGSRPQKKVIAQQVEKVFPQAVSQSTDVVPDIFKKAAIKDGWVSLATDLKVDERVRLIVEKGDQAVHEVLEVKDGQFRTDLRTEDKQVFVYGREVKDFRIVDYEAIAMLNVSATQELARKLETATSEVETLKQELADMKQVVAQLARESKSAKLAANPPSQIHPAAGVSKPLVTASLDQ